MKATALYKTASVLLVLAAAGNTYGLVRLWQVAGAMNSVRFPLGHTNLSYAQVVLGLELFCSLCVLFAAYLAWHLGDLVRNAPQAIGALGWLLFAYQLVGVYMSLTFFAGPVLILSTVLAICLGWAAWLSTRVSAARAPAR